MPYPPPHGPPGDSIFQGIGLNPEEGLPDQTGHAGDFLETDGTLASWEPVSGSALPDQTGNAGKFLTTDGVNASWAVTGNGFSIHDVRNFGAVSAANGNDISLAVVDCAPAFYAAVAAFENVYPGGSNLHIGAVYWPEGDWYIGRPLQIGRYVTEMFGDGEFLSRIRVGPGTDATPSLVQGFAGAAVYYAGYDGSGLGYPHYVSPLVGVTGRALQLKPGALGVGSLSYVLNDSYPWCGWMYADNVQAFTLRLWADVPTYVQNAGGDILTSYGPLELLDTAPWPNRQDITLALDCIGNGSNQTTFRFRMTTYGASYTWGTYSTATVQSAGVSAGIHNVEVCYDGSHVDLWVDGVSQGPVAIQGSLRSTPWEKKVLGGSQGNPINGAVDSIELADVARHTPGVNFTPPTSKYVADSHTMWLANFDQGDPVTGDIWAMITQTKLNNVTAGLAKHYVHTIEWETYGLATYYVRAHHLGLYCNDGTAGIEALLSPWSYTHDLRINQPAGWGFYLPSNTSFYSVLEQVAVDNCRGIGVLFAGWGSNIWTRYNAIGVQLNFGSLSNCLDQPWGGNQTTQPWASFIPFVVGAGAGDSFSTQYLFNCNNDNEGEFSGQQSALLVVNGSNAHTILQGNVWSAIGSNGAAVTYSRTNPSPNGAIHIGDQFYAQPGNACVHFNYPTANSVKWINCGTPFRLTDPLTNLPEDYLLEQYEGGTHTLQRSISTSGIEGTNLAGQFTMTGGHGTTASFNFVTPEPDGNYEVIVTYKGHNGSAPAANSWLQASGGITTSAAGFTFDTQADPGAGSQLIFSYIVIRTPAPPEVWEFSPTVPSTVTNPLEPGVFYVGMTLTPASGNVFFNANGVPVQTAVEAGTAIGTNFWDVELIQGFGIQTYYNAGAVSIRGSFVTQGTSLAPDGILAGMLNPGPHNVASGILRYYQGALNLPFISVDGQQIVLSSTPVTIASQQTPLRIGEHSGGTQTLTTAVISDFKVDNQLYKVLTPTPLAGPQAGMTESAFFGAEIVVGRNPDTGGGFASQLADTKYGGNEYYWMACNDFVTAQDLIDPNPGNVNSFWARWGQHRSPVLANAVVCLGWDDIWLYGRSAATIGAQLTQLVSGTQATANFYPQGQNTPSKTIYDGPNSGLIGVTTSTIAVGGFTVTCKYLDNTASGGWGPLSAADAVATANGIPGLLAIVTPSAAYNVGADQWDLVFTSVATGYGSEAQTVVYTTNNGAKGYPASPTQLLNPPGVNDRIFINGNQIDAKTLGTQDLTIDNIITNIAAVPALTGVITAVRDNSTTPHSLKITAVAAGVVGNAITVGVTGAGTSHWINPLGQVSTLGGGVDGMVQAGIPNIVLCNVPPFTPAQYTAPNDAVRVTLNGLIAGITGTGVTIADIDTLLRDPGAHQNINPAYLNAGNDGLNEAGHTALVGLIGPLIP